MAEVVRCNMGAISQIEPTGQNEIGSSKQICRKNKVIKTAVMTWEDKPKLFAQEDLVTALCALGSQAA